MMGMCKRVCTLSGTTHKSPHLEEIDRASLILHECLLLVPARISLIQIYTKFTQGIFELGTEELLSSLGNYIFEGFKLRENVILESRILNTINESRLFISAYKYKESLFSIFACKQLLQEWPGPANKWLNIFTQALTAKVSLYFFDHLNAGPFRDKDIAKIPFSYLPMLELFTAKAQPSIISLIYEVDSLKYPIHVVSPDTNTLGYIYPIQINNENGIIENPSDPYSGYDVPSGIRSFPSIFNYPVDSLPPMEHWPNLVSLIQSTIPPYDNDILSQKPYVYTDPHGKFVYFILRMEERVICWILFEFKRVKEVKKDLVKAFLEELKKRLHFSDVCALLKPNS